MGAASCKSSKPFPENQQKDDKNNITIGVFGLDDAGKTSTVRAIEGDPTDNVSPTMGSNSTMVIHPLNEKNDRNNNKNKNQQRIRMIDVSGERKFRQYSWSQYYDEIHGLIFVIDASERDRFRENQETLEDLLENDKLKNKPILILANKQDQRGAISNEYDLKRKLNIEKLKAKHKIEICTALPQDDKNKVDESIRKGFSWLIRTIDDNYTELNLRVIKAKNSRTNKKFNQFDNDKNNSDDKYFKAKTTNYTNKNTDYHSKITLEKLPNIFTSKNKIKVANDDDDDDVKLSSTNDYNKKKKVLGGNKSNDTLIKRSTSNDPKAFRSTYESFPEETPWSTSSTLKITKSDDMLSRFSPKSSITNDTKRRNLSPLIHDTKSYTNGSLSKRDNVSDDEEEDYYGQQKSKSTNRFDNSSFSTNKFSSNIKKPSSSMYDDDDNIYNKTNDHHTITTSKKSYSRYDDNDDDDKYNYLKTSTTTKTNKSYDFNDNKNYQRSSDRLNLNNEYRGTLSKTTNRTKYDDDDDDDRPSSSLKKKPNSRFDDDNDDDDYNSTSKPITRSTYNNNYSTSKPINRSKYNDNDNRWSSSKYDDDDHLSSSTKSTNLSKFKDNHYSSSKSMTHSKYDNEDRSYSSSKPISRSKYEDDDYPNTSKKSNYTSSYNNNNNNYGTNTSRSRFEDDDDFFTSNGESNNANRFRK